MIDGWALLPVEPNDGVDPLGVLKPPFDTPQSSRFVAALDAFWDVAGPMDGVAVDLQERQVCHAHLVPDFQAMMRDLRRRLRRRSWLVSKARKYLDL